MPLTDFQQAFDAALGAVQGAGDRLLGAGLQFRASAAGGFEAAIATAAAAVAHAQMEPVLALAPQLPDATAASVCEAFDASANAARQTLPFALTATVLASDPRVAPMIVALLADEQALRQALAQAAGTAADAPAIALALTAGLPAALSSPLLGVMQPLGTLLRQGGADPMAQGELVRAGVSELRNGAANALAAAGVASDLAVALAAVVGGAVNRVHEAAERGVEQVYGRASAQLAALRAPRIARTFPGRLARRVSLDREYPGIVAGSLVLLDQPGYSELFRVTAASHGARAEFALSGKSTAVALSGENLSLFETAVRETTVFARPETLPRARTPLTTPLSGDQLPVQADVRGLTAGRRVIVQGPRASDGAAVVHAATLVSATPAASPEDGGMLVITPPLPEPLRREGTVVYGNVAPASHGETVAQLLGSGDAAQAHQRFALAHAPLTHRSAANAAGAQAELTVRVGDRAWQPRSSLYGAGPTEPVYTLETDAQGQVWVQFGDGIQGARLPTRPNHLRASYRKGLGQAGNVAANSLTQPSSRPLGFKSVANPAPALGGTDPEPVEAARQSLPLQTRTLGRAVSVLDYEDFARAFAGVAKAQAAVLQLAAGPTVCVTVAGPGGSALMPGHPVWQHLLQALRSSGDPHVPLRLLGHRSGHFQLGLKVKADPALDGAAVLLAVEAALRQACSFEARALGEPVLRSQLVAIAHSVPGVLAVDIDWLYGGHSPAAQTQPDAHPRLLAERLRAVGGQPQAAELLSLDPGPLRQLELMS